MRIIGVTGGVGSGKSTVLELLRTEYGAGILEMDALGRRLMEPGEACFDAVVREFGRNFLLRDGRLDRKRLAEKVFRDEEALGALNAIVHPAVRREVERGLSAFRAEGRSLAVLESAILLEAGYREVCSEIWYVRADREVRIRRLMESRGYTRERCEAVMKNQKDQEELSAAADRILDNDGDLKELKEQIARSLSL